LKKKYTVTALGNPEIEGEDGKETGKQTIDDWIC